MDRLNTSDQRRSDRISYFDHLAYFRITAPPFNVAVHRAVAPSDGHMPQGVGRPTRACIGPAPIIGPMPMCNHRRRERQMAVLSVDMLLSSGDTRV